MKEEKEKIFELVFKAKKGEESAFEKLYYHYFVPIFRYIFFRVETKEEAEDLTQKVFLKAWEGLRSFERKTNSFSSWLYKIAKNTIVDYYKERKNFVLKAETEILNKIKDKKSDPLEIAKKKEMIDFLKKAIEELTPDQKEVIVLKFINDLSNKEIAKIMGKTEEAIRALQYRALLSLREKFKKLNLL